MDSILENKNLSVDVLIELNKDLAKEVEHQNLAMDQLKIEVCQFKEMHKEAMKQVEELETDKRILHVQIDELKHAFRKVEQGKEKDLENIKLTYFAKRQELVGKYNSIVDRYNCLKEDTKKDIELKDKIVIAEKRERKNLVDELTLAKLIISDPVLVDAAKRRFKQTIETVKDEKVLKDGCLINELLDDYWRH